MLFGKLKFPNSSIKGNTEVLNEKLIAFKLDHVSFCYKDVPAIKDVSLNIKSGSKIAIVGKNGAGKTTLLKLVMKLYMPTEGALFFNNIDYSKMDTKSFYARVSSVFQNVYTYALSVEENITLGNFSSNTYGIESSLKDCGLLEKIKALPLKEKTLLSTEINEEGIDFSGGENQKLAIARALYKNSDIVIMDEPSSAEEK